MCTFAGPKGVTYHKSKGTGCFPPLLGCSFHRLQLSRQPSHGQCFRPHTCPTNTKWVCSRLPFYCQSSLVLQANLQSPVFLDYSILLSEPKEHVQVCAGSFKVECKIKSMEWGCRDGGFAALAEDSDSVPSTGSQPSINCSMGSNTLVWLPLALSA